MLRRHVVMLTLAALAAPAGARGVGASAGGGAGAGAGAGAVSAAVEVRRGVDFEIVQPGWDALARRPLFAPAMRPTLSGPEKTRPTADGCCLIHWTETGTDAVAEDSLADLAPANGLPDAIDASRRASSAGARCSPATSAGPRRRPTRAPAVTIGSMSM